MARPARSKTNKKSRRKTLRIILIGLAALALIAAYFVFGPNTGSMSGGQYLFIHTGSDYTHVKKGLAAGGFVRWDPLESTCRHASLSIL